MPRVLQKNIYIEANYTSNDYDYIEAGNVLGDSNK